MSQDEFDETSYTDPVVDVSTVARPSRSRVAREAGNGRKLATQALLRCHWALYDFSHLLFNLFFRPFGIFFARRSPSTFPSAVAEGSLSIVAILLMDFQAHAGEGTATCEALKLLGSRWFKVQKFLV